MVFNETAIHQKRTKFNFYRSRYGLNNGPGSIVDPYRKASDKRPLKIQNVSAFMKYNCRPNLLRQHKTTSNKQANNNNNNWTTGSWFGTGTYSMWRGERSTLSQP